MIDLEQVKSNNAFDPDSYSVTSLVLVLGLAFIIFFSAFSYLLIQNINNSPQLLAVSGVNPVEAKQPRDSRASEEFIDKKEQEKKKKEKQQPELKPGVEIKKDWEAESILVRDHKTGKILLSKNADKQHPLASITKLMSAMVLLDNGIDWSERISVTNKDIPESMVDSGESYSKTNLWTASLVGSSNKSMYSLVEDLEWPLQAFIQRMNKKAQNMGMTDTYFVDTTGLDKNSVSTARDISILLREAMKHKKIQKALTTDQVKIRPKNEEDMHHIWNTNWLLLGWIPNKFEKIYGGKTGHIEAAGYNFTVQVSDQKGHVLDVVVLGTKSHEARFKVAQKAARWVFENYDWPK
ncbi:MAG: D-alanyl-D-alanine carboxypeptidase family protein [Candidatus Paceibacteria bacterium]